MTTTTKQAIETLFAQTKKLNGEIIPLFYNSEMKKRIVKDLLNCTDLNKLLLAQALICE